MKPTRPIIIAGASGHADVVFDCVMDMKLEVVGFIDPNIAELNYKYNQPLYRDIREISNMDAYNYLIAIGDSSQRRRVYEAYCALSLTKDNFPFIIHPSASISAAATIMPAAIILRNTIIESGVVVSTGSLINNASVISHGVILGEFSSIGPSVTIAGNARVGSNASIGMGSNIIHNCKIGSGSIIGAGSTVIEDIPDETKAWGVPAKPMT